MTQWNFSKAVVTHKADKSIKLEGTVIGFFDAQDRPILLQVKLPTQADGVRTLHWPDYEIAHA